MQELATPAGWEASLKLEFSAHLGRTTLTHREHYGPLRVQKPLYPEGGRICHAVIVHPPGGIAGGDRLHIDVNVRDGAQALITTPGATKLYRSPGRPSRIEHHVLSSGGGTFEWLPQETIAYAGAQADVETVVQLGAGAQFIGWDITCLGQDNRGLPSGALTQRWHIERGGRSLWRERSRFDGGSDALQAPWGLGGRTVFGTLVITGAEPSDVEAAREACGGSELDWFAVTRLGEVLLCRYLGYSAEAARRGFQSAWAILRRRRLGRDAHPPRVWAT